MLQGLIAQELSDLMVSLPFELGAAGPKLRILQNVRSAIHRFTANKPRPLVDLRHLEPLAGRGEEDTLRAHAERDLTKWNAIENHRTATKGDRETTAWLVDEINAAGQTAEVETFPFLRRDLGTCVVEVSGQTIPGVPLFDGGLTEPDGVEGTLAPLGGEGDIAVTRYGPHWSHPLTQKMDKARKENRYKAIVAIADGQLVRPGLALLNADSYMSAYGPPVLQVSTERGQELENAAADRSTVRVVAHAANETDDSGKCGGSDRRKKFRSQTANCHDAAQCLVDLYVRTRWWSLCVAGSDKTVFVVAARPHGDFYREYGPRIGPCRS